MEFHLGEVGYVADVVAFAILVDIFEPHLPTGQDFCTIEGFKDARTVGSAAADIVDLAATRFLNESVDKTGNVDGVDVVADLLTRVAIYLVEATFHIALDEVAQEAM